MRAELGLPTMPVDERTASRRSDDWPWMPDRPAGEAYIQNHRPVRRGTVDDAGGS
jgi:hypothetical protein